MHVSRLISLAVLLISGCGRLDYESVSSNGRFEGRLFVMWVGEGSPYSGDGQFVFVPNPDAPLKFTRYGPNGQQIGAAVQPEIMYTDGGSIPRIATIFKGFSPWGYAPAYMVHDWLFIANHCNNDGTPTPEEVKHRETTFSQSALVIAEAIKALQVSGQVSKNDVAGSVISSAVAGPISRGLWERDGACEGHRVTEEHRLAAYQAFPQPVRAGFDSVGLDPERITTLEIDYPPPALLLGEFGWTQ